MSLTTMENASRRGQTARRWYSALSENIVGALHLREQMALLVIFGFLLLLVALACAGVLSLVIVCGLIGGLAITALVLLKPQFALALIFLGAGLPSLLIPLPGHTMRPLEAPLFLGVAIIIVRRPGIRLRLPHLFALLFFAIAIISFIHVPDVAQSLGNYGADKSLFAWTLILLAFFGGTFLAGYIKNLSTFLCLALLLNLPFLLIGLAQSLHIHLPSLLIPSTALEVTQEGRLSGPSDSPTTFAFYLIDLLALAVVCWTLGIRRWQRWTGALMLLLILWEIVGSGTRSALGVAVILIIIALLITRRFKWLIGLAFLAIPLTGVLLNAVLPKFLHGNTSLTNRLFLWQQALKLIAANPWIGIGLQQFPTYYAKLIVGQAAELNPAGISVHNQYLELALESGLLWLIVGLCLLFSLILVCWKMYRFATREHRPALLATILIVLGYLMISFVDVPLDKPEGAVFLFLLAGLALGYTVHAKKRPAAVPTKTAASSDSLGRGSGGLGTGKLTAGQSAFCQPDIALTLRLATPYVRAARRSGTRDELYNPLPGQLQASDTLPMQLTAPLPRIRITESTGTLPSAPKTGRSALIQIMAWAVAVPLVFPSTALMTRYFGPAQFGEYNFTLSILAVCALCTMTGMDSWLIRHLSRRKRAEWSQILGDALGTRLLTSLVVTGAAALLIWFLPLASEQRILLLLGMGTLTFSFSFNCVRAICECGFAAEQRVSIISLLTTLNRVATAGLIVLAVILRLSLIQAYILIAYSDLPFFLVLLLIVSRRYRIRLRFKPARIWSILRESLAFTGYDALALFSGQIDILLLLPLAGSLSVGIYALALRITNPLLNIAFAYVGALYPLLCSRFDRGKQEFARIYHEATRILTLGIIPLSLFIIVEAPALVSLLAGGDFAQAVMPTRLLMTSIALVFFSQLTLRACMAANKEKTIPLISAVILVTTLMANGLLIPRWQADGAALAALLTELISVSLFAALLAKQVDLGKTLVGVLLVCAGNLPGLAFLLWQPHLPLFVLAGGFAVLVPVGYIITRSLTLKDVHMTIEMVKGRSSRKKAEATEAGGKAPALRGGSH